MTRYLVGVDLIKGKYDSTDVYLTLTDPTLPADTPPGTRKHLATWGPEWADEEVLDRLCRILRRTIQDGVDW